MEKVRYMISDAAALAGVETHVLRYWEEELDLTIPRNVHMAHPNGRVCGAKRPKCEAERSHHL